MNPQNQPTPSAPSGLTAALLLAAAGSLLAGAPAASAQTYNESSAPGGDFGNSFALRTLLTLGTTAVNSVQPTSSSDPDFFTFSGLAGNTPYTLGISAGQTSYVATFQGYNDAGTAIGSSASYNSNPANTSMAITGTVPASGILTIGVNPQTYDAELGTGTFTAVLTATAIPEPATVTVVALGAALAALAARRNRKQNAAE